MIRVRSKTKEALFPDAASGLFSIIFSGNTEQKTVDKRKIHLSADCHEDLLIAWLNELIYLFDTEGFVPVRCFIIHLERNDLYATCFGYLHDKNSDTSVQEIKAATHHLLSLTSEDGAWQADIVFDV